ncbi:MAG: condensation domain-containing protein, partial [Acidobacteriota bacterium]
LRRELDRRGFTVLFLTTALLQQFARQDPKVYSGLRAVFFGGERCDPDAVRAALSGGPEGLIHAYGPSEATTYATTHPVDAVSEDAAAVSIGGPIGNTDLWVFDRWGRPSPLGAVGELGIGGDGLAIGYHRRPALTAAAFVPHPMSTTPGARLYRTGDLVRLPPSGHLEFIGRADHQVKVRGFRVELGEIEAALGHHPGVAAQAVALQSDDAGSTRLVAFVVAEGGGAPSAGELRAFLGRSLPDYLVPSAYQVLDRLPLTPNGKVNRGALPTFDFSKAGLGETVVEPRTDVERRLADLWRGILKADRLSVDANFFELGGHSLLGTQLLSRVRDVFGVDLPLRALFQAPTVAELAGQLEAADTVGSFGTEPILERAQGEPELSPGQRRLWFLHRLDPGSPVYNIPVAFELRGDLDTKALARALSEIVARHDVLRSRYLERGGRPAVVIDPPSSLDLPVEALPAEDPIRLEAALRREARDPFDLEADPMLRARLYRLGERHHVLALTVHHIASDGWSHTLIAEEMATLYGAFRRGEPSPLEPLPLQYADVTAWRDAVLSAGSLERDLAWWRRNLESLVPTEIPGDRPRPPVQSFRGGLLVVDLQRGLSEALRSLARRRGRTLFATMLAGFYAVLSRYAGTLDLAVGTPSAGRDRSELESLVGFFVNSLVLRCDLSGDPDFDDVAARAEESFLGAQAHGAVPFDKLVEELQPERDTSRNPFFQLFFQVLDLDLAPKMADLDVRAVDAHSGTAKFDLGLTLFDRTDGMRIEAEYATDLFDPATVERFLGAYETLLTAAVEDPTQKLSTLPVIPRADRELLEETWNATAEDYPPNERLGDLLDRQAAATPDAVALVTADPSVLWTYRRLSEGSHRLARELREGHGVGPGVLVALCLDRSADLVVAMLAVVHSGGAYV